MSDSLLHRVASGDQPALESFMDRFGALVWSLSRRFSRDRSDAEEAAQDALLAIWRVADRYDASKASEETFVAMIARRKLIERMRRQSNAPIAVDLPSLADVGTPAASFAERSEDVARAGQVLADLRLEEQRVIRMSVLQGLTHAEISARLGMPIGTVKTNIRRALARVRDVIMGKLPPTPTRRPPV